MDSNGFDLNLSLSLEQEFKMKLMEHAAEEMSREQALSLLMEASRQLMIKDNVIKDLIKQNLAF